MCVVFVPELISAFDHPRPFSYSTRSSRGIPWRNIKQGMSLEDPFFVVKEEVQKALNNVNSLYARWQELLNNPMTVGRDDHNSTTNELRNNLRSIEWDLEDLDETIGIVEVNPRKFSLDDAEVNQRKQFIKRTRDSVNRIKEHMNSPAAKAKVENSSREALMGRRSNKPHDRYSRLDREIENSNQDFIVDQHQQQELLIRAQDDQLELVGHSVGVLKNMGKRIGDELEDQNVMLDDFGHEIEMTDSKLQQTVLKVEKVLRLSDDKRQTCVLVTLIIIMIIVIILFIAL